MCVGLVSYERLHLSCASHSCIITKQIAKKVGMYWRTAKVCNQATGRKMGGDGVEGWVEDLFLFRLCLYKSVMEKSARCNKSYLTCVKRPRFICLAELGGGGGGVEKTRTG